MKTIISVIALLLSVSVASRCDCAGMDDRLQHCPRGWKHLCQV